MPGSFFVEVKKYNKPIRLSRDPREGEPVFFDPNKDVPTPLDEAKMMEDVLGAFNTAGLPPGLFKTPLTAGSGTL